jgi:hypothetical protein
MVIDNMFKKLGLMACLVIAGGLVGCGDDPAPAECPAGQIKAQVGDAPAACYTQCTTSTECGATERCSGGVCLPRTSGGDMGTDMTMPDQGTDMTMPDQGMDMTMPDQGMDMMPDMNNNGDPDVALCQTALDKLFKSCVTSQCGAAVTAATQMQLDAGYNLFLNGGQTPQGTRPPCAQAVKMDPNFRNFIQQLASQQATCAVIKEELYCAADGLDLGDECTCPVRMPPTNLGAACSSDATCDAGALEPFCTSDDPADPGICLAVGCSLPRNAMENTIYPGSSTGCGNFNEGACVALRGQRGLFGVCIETCSVDADCAQNPATGCDLFIDPMTGRPVMVNNQPFGQCAPRCASDADCVGEDANGNPVQGTCNANRFCE